MPPKKITNVADAKEKKETLFDLAKTSETKEYIIVGALCKAGLLKQYNQEKKDYGINDITPSMTLDEFNKIINDFLGE